VLLRVGFELRYTVPSDVTVVALLRPHPSRDGDVRAGGGLTVTPLDQPLVPYLDAFGNVADRFVARAGEVVLSSDLLVEDHGAPDPVVPGAGVVAVMDLPPADLHFLLPSRYCEVDLLGDTAWELFGGITPGWAQVQAVCDWVHEQLTYGYEHARSTMTAVDALAAAAGVCRDYQHLAITLCRCLNIPARYVSGWLGDIGIEPVDTPMDFHAWFEARLDGGWYPFDARHNVPRIGRIPMARGRDAADVAFTTAFGDAPLTSFTVWADEDLVRPEGAGRE
jgi:transglutaminase-like putative cysteine protease